jgi:hypothetical protein
MTRLRPGRNELAIAAANAPTDIAVNPAGLIGRLTIEFESGAPLTVRVDQGWKASQEIKTGRNAICIVPFAPKSARLLVCE